MQVHKTITKREESSFLDVVYAGSMVELTCGLAQNTGGPQLVRHLCQKLLKNCTIVNLGQAHTKFRTNQGH